MIVNCFKKTSDIMVIETEMKTVDVPEREVRQKLVRQKSVEV